MFRAFEKWEGTVYSGVFFLFSTQNQVPQIFIAIGRVIYHIKVLLIVIRTILKNLKSIFFSVEKSRFEIFDFWSNLELIPV